MTGFHAKDGLFFERINEAGDVKISVVKEGMAGSEVVFETVIREGSWASAMASVSRDGEDVDRWCRARHYHMGDSFAGNF